MDNKIKEILVKFAESGWDLIAKPANDMLNNNGDKEIFLKAVKLADDECGNCGCEYDAMYKYILNNANLI